MRTVLLLMLVFGLSGGLSFAQPFENSEWFTFNLKRESDTAEDPGKLAIHLPSIETVSASNVKFWFRRTFSAPKSPDNGRTRILNIVALYMVNCDSKQSRQLYSKALDETGNVIYTYSEPLAWEYIPPDGWVYKVASMTCFKSLGKWKPDYLLDRRP